MSSIVTNLKKHQYGGVKYFHGDSELVRTIYPTLKRQVGKSSKMIYICAMNQNIETLHIMPGLLCNFSCNHCVNESGPSQKIRMSEDEIKIVSDEIRVRNPKKIIFTGGEPTLHTEIINTLLRAHPALENTEIFITSNGWYSISDRLISDTLNKILKIDHLQLSFDVYHGSKIGMDDIKRLRNFLKEKGVKFNISICISSPADLAGANSLQNEIGELVIFQKVDSTGRARENKLEFKYPKFEKEVLNKKCPNIGQITFVANRGFSVCCSNLAFNSQSNEIFHRSIEDHLSSEFYKQIERKTFGEILLIDGDVEISNFSSEFSSPCRMCEFVHKRK